jgi:peptide/nickel transport system substrate-binding protein
VLSNGSSETIDVRKAIVTPDAIRVQAIYDPLFFVVPGGTAPGLAESAEPNSDATKWTVKIRDGVTWHDGKPLTADDVVYTIRSSWGSKNSNYGGQTKALVDLKNVRKIDQRTVEVPLLRPFAGFEAFASFYTSYVVQDGTTDFSRPVGTGPFKFGSFEPGAHSSFSSNPDYWRGKPLVDELVVDSSFTDDPARINALASGQIDIAPNVPPALAKANASSGRIVLGNAHGPAFIAVVMRVNVPPFNDARVVQAFKLAVDRQAVVNTVFDGYATLGNDSAGATFKYWASDIKPQHDPEKAKALLKAGTPPLGPAQPTPAPRSGGSDDASLPTLSSACGRSMTK